MSTPHDSRREDGQELSAEHSQAAVKFREFVTGGPTYKPVAVPMSAWLAAIVTVGIVVAAQLLAVGIDQIPTLVQQVTTVKPAMPGGQPADTTAAPAWDASPGRLMRLTLLSQIMVVVLTLVAARQWGGLACLRLVPPSGGWRIYAFALAAMLPIIALVNALGYLVAPADMFRDFKFFADIARSDDIATTALAIGAGAPLSEELLFRGFLLTALSATAFGYWRAAILAALAWTALHFAYSWVGLAEVFCIGLYLSWLLWRTGSLLPPLFCHALYNSCLLAALRFWPQ